jgi:hypothetical protein
MALASIPGRLDQYIALKREGLNTIELDVKDENGQIAQVFARGRAGRDPVRTARAREGLHAVESRRRRHGRGAFDTSVSLTTR